MSFRAIYIVENKFWWKLGTLQRETILTSKFLDVNDMCIFLKGKDPS